jgi:hypothetical protein
LQIDIIAKLLLRIVAANGSLQVEVIAKLLLQTVTANCSLQIVAVAGWLLQIIITNFCKLLLLEIIDATVVVTKVAVTNCCRKLLSQIVLHFITANCFGKIGSANYCSEIVLDCYFRPLLQISAVCLLKQIVFANCYCLLIALPKLIKI